MHTATADGQNIQSRPAKKGCNLGWRHIVTVLCFFGFFFLYALKVNLSVAIVAMVNHTAIHEVERTTGGNAHDNVDGKVVAEVCTREQKADEAKLPPKKDGPFVWDQATQGNILGSFFYGYILTQIPGGLLATKFGGKWVFGLGTFLTAVFTLLTPVAAESGPTMLIIVRILMGVAEGVTWPATQSLFAKWAPPSERRCFIGTLTAFIVSGFLADSSFLGGWPSIFYVFGVLGIVWFILWTLFVTNGPEDHRFISNAEKNFIVNSLKVEGGSGKSLAFKDVPWRKILTSAPIWAGFVSHFTYNWSLYVLLTGLPLYFKSVLGFDLKSNGVLSSLPYLIQAIIQSIAGQVADMMRTRLHLSTKTVRKIMDCLGMNVLDFCFFSLINKTMLLGHLLPGLCVIFVGYVGCNSAAAVALLAMSVGFSGLCGGGFFVNYLDLCPQYTGIVFGISNTLATVPGILGPNITGYLTRGAPSFESWRIVFFIAGAHYFVSVIFYAIFAQGTVQPWAQAKSPQNVTLAATEEDDS
ncbi:transporter, major facilitator family protein [Trichinella nativa]|uniref:Transporter, major facilitator family protein n=1 Tax=Trichinella nativa TaxID=6335 RepID=A0A1Y3EWC3_9BILA|nr:transporter, major facilitator family protein [Trichinella nativa]